MLVKIADHESNVLSKTMYCVFSWEFLILLFLRVTHAHNFKIKIVVFVLWEIVIVTCFL